MPQEKNLVFAVDTALSVLSSESGIHKTERFINETRRFADTDIFISKLAEGIILEINKLDIFEIPSRPDNIACFRLQTEDGAHIFYIKFGFMTPTRLALSPKDIIFFHYADKENSGRRNDQSFASFMRDNKTFRACLYADKYLTDEGEFLKLYNLSCADRINFPLLNAEQTRIVETEDKNVLVQGVAGSGKTNICINKLIFTAMRNYAGRTLYTTYSRGLLLDTRSRVEAFNRNLKSFVRDYHEGRVVFADKHHKKAIENKFAMAFPALEDEKIVSTIKSISNYLENSVDYFLVEDIFNKYAGGAEAVDESYFVKKYVKNIRNHQLVGKLNRVGHLSYEVIFKEIYGMILGCCDPSRPQKQISLAEYTEKRKDSFTTPECEILYSLAKDYLEHLAQSGFTDNNIMSRRLLAKADTLDKYSLAIIDEVQDMTEVSLCLFKLLARKLFCVGDALQMINPSYFSFAYLKNLLFEKDIVSVAELTNNFRNTRRIAEIIDELGAINIGKFGTHSFVLKGKSIESSTETSAVYVKGGGFIEAVAQNKFDNFTVIVSGNKEKEELRKLLARQEILTVSEIKGLERDTVILYNVLSDNLDKWNTLERTLLNRKRADENSVYRYYFNLFYVGVSRAKNHLYVAENKSVPLFKAFFERNLDEKSLPEAIRSLTGVVSRIETDQEELIERVGQFINLGQFDNARFAAGKIQDDIESIYQLDRIDVFEKFISHGNYREAGIRFWELGRPEQAKEQFALSGDATLAELVDACSGQGEKALDIDIIRYLIEVEGNESARRLILQTVQSDLKQLSERQKQISAKLKKIKERKHG